MKCSIYLIFALITILVSSCDDRIGYYDGYQNDRIALLTGKKWFMYYQHRPPFQPEEFDSEGNVCSFSADGKGTFKVVDSEGEIIEGYKVQYFQWTFTTDTFSVLYLGGNMQQFWLIDKLTPSELWIHCGAQDPAIYPNTDQTEYRFRVIE